MITRKTRDRAPQLPTRVGGSRGVLGIFHIREAGRLVRVLDLVGTCPSTVQGILCTTPGLATELAAPSKRLLLTRQATGERVNQRAGVIGGVIATDNASHKGDSEKGGEKFGGVHVNQYSTPKTKAQVKSC